MDCLIWLLASNSFSSHFSGFVELFGAFVNLSITGYCEAGLNDLMESKGGKKKSSSSKSLFYEAPLGYSIEDVRPNGGIKKFRSAAYSNVSFILLKMVR